MTTLLPDVQNETLHRHLALDWVGVKQVKHPVSWPSGCGSSAFLDLYVTLSAHQKGTHMSRFLEELGTTPLLLEQDTLERFFQNLCNRFPDTSNLFMQLKTDLFIQKQAPVSRVPSLMDYGVALTLQGNAEGSSWYLHSKIPVTTLCPCSKQISDYGAHNQRSYLYITVHLSSPFCLNTWYQDLIAWVEQEASCPLYSLLKRPDEKWVTEYAYDHPKFVEDLVRDVAHRLTACPEILSYRLSLENLESIHNHMAFADLNTGIQLPFWPY